MGEQAKKIGDKLENFGSLLFSKFGWTELAKNTEIKCTRSGHSKKTHGLDLLMSFYNPYLACKQGIVIECKNRQMKAISGTTLNQWVLELINAIECAQTATELNDIDLKDTNICTGLLLVHANDTFDNNKFQSYLKELKIHSKKNPINIFIAGNNEINKWTALFHKIETSYSKEFHFVFPSIGGSDMTSEKFITINQLYSRFIFAQDICTKTTKISNYNMEQTIEIKRKIFISFDEISPNSFKYMWSMFKFYQLQEADELVFLFYPYKKDDVEFIKSNFIQIIKEANPNIPDDILNKIRLDFIDNRELSPIDTLRG